MKTAVISDIHGNFPALQAVLNDIDEQGAAQIICLGDLVGYYCMINEVIDLLKQRSIPSLMGNHDFALCYNSGVIERSKTCTRVLGRQLNEIRPDNLTWLNALDKELKFTLNGQSYFCVHGGLEDPIDEYIRDIDTDYFERNGFKDDVLISGHTHILRNEIIGRYEYLNPGSVGQPRDGNPDASYLLIENGVKTHRRVKYDIDRITRAMAEKEYEPYIYEILYRGVKVGG